MSFSHSSNHIKSVGIVVPANIRGGPEKASAILASSLAEAGYRVVIFVPILPWYYYFVSLDKNPLMWLRYSLPILRRWLRKREFAFSELLDQKNSRSRISVKFVLRYASKRQLKGLDCLYVDSIAQVYDYRHRFPQQRQIYLLWHPEEHSHGHAEKFKEIRKSFSGKIIVASPVIAKQVSDHIANPPLVPAPISLNLWEQREIFDVNASRKDILLLWKNNQHGNVGADIVKALKAIRPRTSVTVWCWGLGTRDGALAALPGVVTVENLTESQLRDLYLNHSLLIFPSEFEGFGMPPIEALACGCIPVLRPDVGAAELYAKDGENSLFMNNDLAALVKRLASVLDSPERLRTMRKAAPASILKFDPNTYGPRILMAAGVE